MGVCFPSRFHQRFQKVELLEIDVCTTKYHTNELTASISPIFCSFLSPRLFYTCKTTCFLPPPPPQKKTNTQTSTMGRTPAVRKLLRLGQDRSSLPTIIRPRQVPWRGAKRPATLGTRKMCTPWVHSGLMIGRTPNNILARLYGGKGVWGAEMLAVVMTLYRLTS